MPYGAHETMEAHEILNEKMNLINHLALYRTMCQSNELRQMIDRQLEETRRAYDQIAAYTHDYVAARFSGMSPYARTQGSPQQVVYGLHQPAPMAPQLDGKLDDQQIALAMLSAHKSSAKNHMAACLETADPNLRRMLCDGAVVCSNMAYETFMFMNRNGDYQVPTMQDQTAKTFLHAYQSSDPGRPFEQPFGGMPAQTAMRGGPAQHTSGQPPAMPHTNTQPLQ